MKREFCLIVTSVLALILNYNSLDSQEWDIETGAKYNAILQKSAYFEEDTLSVISEYMLFFKPEYDYRSDKHRFTGSPYLSIGSKSLKGKLETLYKYKSDKLYWYLREDIEGRLYHTAGESGKNYLKNYLKGSIDYYIGKWSLISMLSMESKKYQENESYRLDYHLGKLELGTSVNITDNDQLELTYQYGHREVPDSHEVGYDKHIVDLYWERWWGFGNYLTMLLEYESRNYFQPDEEDDYSSFYGQSSGMFYLGSLFSITTEYEYNFRHYAIKNYIHSDYYKHTLKGGPQFQISPRTKIGTAPEITFSHSDSATFGDSYTDLGVELSLDILKHKQIWVNMTMKPGYRWYDIRSEDDPYGLYSDYFFTEAMLLFNWWFHQNLKLTVMGTYYPEWHDQDQDNITTSYISTKVEYEF
ncbi:hypothetical protein JW877_08150 [bacterium]|nr:hypothetical protein [bacterium]